MCNTILIVWASPPPSLFSGSCFYHDSPFSCRCHLLVVNVSRFSQHFRLALVCFLMFSNSSLQYNHDSVL